MPLIPGVNQTEVKAAAANTPYFSVNATAEEFGSTIGKSMLTLGKDLGDDSDAIAKLRPAKTQTQTTDPTQKDQKKQDGQQGNEQRGTVPDSNISNAIDLVNGFKGNAFSLQSDFFRLGGKAAVDAAPDVLDQLAQLQSDTLAAADSPDSAGLAQSALTKWGQVLSNNVERHAAAQQQVYDDDLDETQIGQSRDAVALLYNDDQNFLMQLRVAAEARADQVARQMTSGAAKSDEGVLATSISGAKASVASNLVAARIAAAVEQGDIPAAIDLHRRWQRDMLPIDHSPVTRLLDAGTFVARIDAETRRILGFGRYVPGKVQDVP
jgi:hypothetical protein